MSGPVLLFDGLCALCDGTVDRVLAADRRRRIRFAPLQGDFAAGVLERHPELEGVDSLILVEDAGEGGGAGDGGRGERVRIRSDAALALASHVGGAWGLLGVFRIVPRPLRDWVYDLVARHRYRVFGRREACRIPTPEERDRFID